MRPVWSRVHAALPYIYLTLSLPESNLESINVALTSKSAHETLGCDHSNESYSSGAVCF